MFENKIELQKEMEKKIGEKNKESGNFPSDLIIADNFISNEEFFKFVEIMKKNDQS